MTVESLIADGRALAPETMLDRGAVTRKSTSPAVLNEITGVLSPADPDVVYVGQLRVKKPTQIERERVFGDVQTSTTRYLVNMPHDSAQAAIGDIVTVSESNDPQLVDKPLRVCAGVDTSMLMFRQLGVEVTEDEQ